MRGKKGNHRKWTYAEWFDWEAEENNTKQEQGKTCEKEEKRERDMAKEEACLGLDKHKCGFLPAKHWVLQLLR